MAGRIDLAAVLRKISETVGTGQAHAAHTLLGIPYRADPLVPEGKAMIVATPARAVVVGIPSRNATEAALIVRHGLADVLEWLGRPVETVPLKLAREHYGLDVPGGVS